MKHLISVPTNVIPHFHSISGLSENDWFVSADPEGRKVGSGGGTAHILSELWKQENSDNFAEWLKAEKRSIIHAGGKSRRLPAYAPMGKSLLPMPVFRWSRGQELNQRLIHLQSGLFDDILKKAPGNLNTLVASGDTLIFGGETLPEIPEADVVCLGLWLEPEKASNHGVFFARHESPQQLEFMLQKPSTKKINELIHDYYFLMDIGIWLLSPKAVNLLMQKSGWKGNSYQNNVADDYDLYSEFGTALGKRPATVDAEISQLSVALVNFEGGAFYHLGNTSELVSTNWAIQNRVNDQREIWHKNIKPHPSIFVLNADIQIKWDTTHKNIWIENACVPGSWSLKQNHALTGIPENNWELNLQKGNCLDIVPLDKETQVIRNYGYTDSFRGEWVKEETQFMEEPLVQWLEKRNLTDAFEKVASETDIQSLPLFPVIQKNETDEKFIQWLLDNEPANNAEFTRKWIEGDRLSADEISNRSDISLTEKQRLHFQLKSIPLLAKNYKHSVFYQLDLNRLAKKYVHHRLELPEEISADTNGWLPIHDQMFRAAYLRKKGLDSSAPEKKAFDYLQTQILRPFHDNKVSPCINLLPDQIAWGRSPVRFDLAGGWTDTPPYCMLYGGKVLNIAAELNGQPPLHCYIKATDKPQIVLRSIDLGEQETVTTYDDLKSFYNIQSAFSIPKAALALAGFLPEFTNKKYSSLTKQLDELGGGLEISILAAVPKGSGLGTSSILAATVLGTLSEVCCLNWDKIEIGRRTMALEQLLTTGGGWQDQYGGLLEGIKYLETAPGKSQVPSTKWVTPNLFTDIRYKNRWLLYYTGITRVAKNILAEIVRGMFLNSSEHLSILEELKKHADQTYETLLQKNFEELGRQIDKSWQLNQQLDSGTNTPEIQQIIDRIKPWMIGQKLLGAGGGGFMLIMAKDEEAAGRIRQELTENPVNPRGRFLDFNISENGFQVTKS
jgi:galactokinase/mevalonate kinase-like predicted kinase